MIIKIILSTLLTFIIGGIACYPILVRLEAERLDKILRNSDEGRDLKGTTVYEDDEWRMVEYSEYGNCKFWQLIKNRMMKKKRSLNKDSFSCRSE